MRRMVLWGGTPSVPRNARHRRAALVQAVCTAGARRYEDAELVVIAVITAIATILAMPRTIRQLPARIKCCRRRGGGTVVFRDRREDGRRHRPRRCRRQDSQRLGK